MSLDARLVKSIHHAMTRDERPGDKTGLRLIEDAQRLWRRLQRFIEMRLVPELLDNAPLELCTYALQLPLRQCKKLVTGKVVKSTLRERAEEAAELLVSTVEGFQIDETLLDRATRILHEMPQRSPLLDEARLLADALNLDDFGIIGLVGQVAGLTRQGDGLLQLIDGLRKRDAYHYWEARLRDGFHFDPVRQMAQKRLSSLRAAQQLLDAEWDEDGPQLEMESSSTRRRS